MNGTPFGGSSSVLQRCCKRNMIKIPDVFPDVTLTMARAAKIPLLVTATIILRGPAWSAWRPVAADMMPLSIPRRTKPLACIYTGHDSRMASIFSTHANFFDMCVGLFVMLMGDSTVGISRVFMASILLVSLPARLLNMYASPGFIGFPFRLCHVNFYCSSPWPSLRALFRSCRGW
jgi:hypothetical protein